MTKLSVNVNKIATLRNARGQNQPHLIKVIKDIIGFGARGITVHPRPDERHITLKDTHEISEFINTYNKTSQEPIEFNIEGYPSDDFLKLILKLKPHQCTLVPDPPDAITSNAGWKCQENQTFLTKVIDKLNKASVRSSLFIEPILFNSDELDSLKLIKPHRVELYTELYAKNFNTPEINDTIKIYKEISTEILSLDININAGHDLSLDNLSFLIQEIPQIKEVSIGHALICESLYKGLKTTIHQYQEILNNDLET